MPLNFTILSIIDESHINSFFLYYLHYITKNSCVLKFTLYLIFLDTLASSELGPLNSPSLPLSTPVGETEECVYLIMECLRATIESRTN